MTAAIIIGACVVYLFGAGVAWQIAPKWTTTSSGHRIPDDFGAIITAFVWPVALLPWLGIVATRKAMDRLTAPKLPTARALPGKEGDRD